MGAKRAVPKAPARWSIARAGKIRQATDKELNLKIEL